MTFTATFPIGYAPGSPRELYNEDEPLVVEFDADVRIERDPVEVDWPPVVERGVSVDCDASSVDIESAMLEIACERCGGEEYVETIHIEHSGFDGFGNSIPVPVRGLVPCDCKGGSQQFDILPTLSAPDLARLKEDCAEWAREHAVEQQVNRSAGY